MWCGPPVQGPLSGFFRGGLDDGWSTSTAEASIAAEDVTPSKACKDIGSELEPTRAGEVRYRAEKDIAGAERIASSCKP